MKINLFFPKCKSCGGDTRRIKIYDAPGEEHLDQKVFRCYGLRCLKCNQVEKELHYHIEIEDFCCKRMKEEFDLNGEGIVSFYEVESGLIIWNIMADGVQSLDDIKFCPFCGAELPRKPNSIPI